MSNHNRDLKNIMHLMNIRSRLRQRLQTNFNTMNQTQKGNISTRIGKGETAIRRKAVQIAQKHGLRVNTRLSVNKITTRLLTQLIMLRGGLSKNIVNANT